MASLENLGFDRTGNLAHHEVDHLLLLAGVSPPSQRSSSRFHPGDFTQSKEFHSNVTPKEQKNENLNHINKLTFGFLDGLLHTSTIEQQKVISH